MGSFTAQRSVLYRAGRSMGDIQSFMRKKSRSRVTVTLHTAESIRLIEQMLMVKMKIFMAKFRNRVRKNAPRVTGRLRQSIETEVTRTSSGNITGTLRVKAPYASAVEFGTGVFGPRHVPIRAKTPGGFMSFRTKEGKFIRTRQVQGQRPQGYLRKSIRKVKKSDFRNVFHDPRLRGVRITLSRKNQAFLGEFRNFIYGFSKQLGTFGALFSGQILPRVFRIAAGRVSSRFFQLPTIAGTGPGHRLARRGIGAGVSRGMGQFRF